MKKFSVTIPYPVFVTVEVEAENAEDAEEAAFEYSGLSGYVGNGGLGNKLVGTNESNVSIEPGEMPIDCVGYRIEVEPIDQ